MYHQQNNLQISYQLSPQSDFYQVKAQVTIGSTIDEFYQLVSDPKQAPSWLDKVNHSELLASTDPKTFIVLTQFAGFWPVSAREMITKTIVIEKSPQNLLLVVSALNSYMPANKGFVRVKKVDVSWQANYDNNDNLVVTYTSYFEPGGNIPTWLSNKLALSSLKTSLQNLQQLKPLPSNH